MSRIPFLSWVSQVWESSLPCHLLHCITACDGQYITSDQCYFFLPDDLGVGTDLEVDEPTFMELRVGAGFPPCKVVALFAEE